MSVDTIANMLSMIKNSAIAGEASLDVPYSKECKSICEVFKKSGYIDEVKVFKPKETSYKKIHLELAKQGEYIKINDIKRISKPGRRVYKKASEIRPSKGEYSTMVVSTSKGIINDQEARKKKLGGELICEVY